MTMRFLADENVSRFIVERLRLDGHDVSWIPELSPGSDDKAVLAAAYADKRALITEDGDFGELVIRQKLPVSGVVLLNLDRLSNEAEAERVAAFIRLHSDIVLRENFIVLEPGRARVRKL